MNKSELEQSLSLIKQIYQERVKYSILYKQSENVSASEIRFKHLKLAETFVCILAFSGFGCAAIISDLTYTHLPNKSKILIISQVICTISTALLLFAIFCRVKQEFLWQQSKGFYSYMDTLSSTRKLNSFYLEVLVNIVHPPIGLESQTFFAINAMYNHEVEYTYATVIVAFMVIRIYHVIRFLSIVSLYRSCRSQRLCHMNGSFADTNYAIKCMMQENPVIVMTWMLLTGIFVFGFLLRIFERPVIGWVSETTDKMDGYGNAMWCIIATMTTVGYGDYYPITIPGRACGCFACIWGVMVISFMCCSLYNLLMLDTGEMESLVTLHRLWFKDEMKDIAAFVLTSVYRYRHMVKFRTDVSFCELEIQLGKVRRYINEFQRARNKQRTLYKYDSYNEILEYKIDEILDLQDNVQIDSDINEILNRLERYLKEEQVE